MPRVNQEIAARLFQKLVGEGKPVLYRNEPLPRISAKMAQFGFDETRQMDSQGTREALGIFNAKREQDLSSLIRGVPSEAKHTATMETVPLPSARYKSFSDQEWNDFVGYPAYTPSQEVTKKLKGMFDFVEYPDVIDKNINPETGERFRQVVQINPNRGLAKFRPGATGWNQTSEIYRILSAAGVAVPALGSFQPETGTGE
jgi:hypothetical protein